MIPSFYHFFQISWDLYRHKAVFNVDLDIWGSSMFRARYDLDAARTVIALLHRHSMVETHARYRFRLRIELKIGRNEERASLERKLRHIDLINALAIVPAALGALALLPRLSGLGTLLNSTDGSDGES